MLRRILLIIASIVIVLALVGVITGIFTIRRSFPQTEGKVQAAGLQGPVDIYRDPYGVPHIYAGTAHDLFFSLGYAHAQDRFWQMDFSRHIATARLSEMFGDSQLDTDRFLRTLGWARVAQQEVENLAPETAAYLQAYTDGVNAYLADHHGSQLSLEYAILKLLNPDYQPEPWQPLHSVAWGKVMAWDLGEGKLNGEIEMATLLKTLTPEQVNEIAPPYPADKPVIVPGFKISSQVQPIAADKEMISALSPALEVLSSRVNGLNALLGADLASVRDGIGSNNWVISGQRTATGRPILANDMHLGVQMPAIWYEAGLHCTQKGPDCPFDVTGFTFPGVPGVIVGHNDRVAWGFTNLGPDVVDLYIEKINPENPNQYEVNGEWVDMQTLQETIQVAGGEPVEQTVRYTRHGPVISDTYGSLEGFDEKSGVQLPEPYAIAMRWTALEPNHLFEAILGYNKAQNWEEFRQAAQNFAVPSQNTVYADIDGNIGYQAPGWIPMRNPGHDGRLPVPGWTDEYEWQGYIPFEQLPHTFNPPQGYIASANNAVVGADYPYPIAYYFAYGYRAQRIVDMIENAPGPVALDTIQGMHGDNKDLNAETLVPVLLQVPLEDEHLVESRRILEAWDYQVSMDSAPAALFNVFWKNLLALTFQDELPEKYWPDGGGRWFEVMRSLVKEPDSAWWDNQKTAEVEGRDQILAQALAAAVAELESLQGKNPEKWNWGDLHLVNFTNQSLGESGVAPIEALFNRGPFRTSGGSDIVNATSWDATGSYEVNDLPSERMIVDLANLNNSLSVFTTGQSGHAYHTHYIDMADLWRTIQYHPMLWDRDQVETAAEGHLQLVP